MDFSTTFAGIDAALMNVLGDSAFLDALGTGVTLVPVKGVFEAPWLQPRIGSLRTEILEPMFSVDQSVDLSGVVKGTSVLKMNGSEYEIVNVEPDGTGMTALILKPI